MLAIWRYLVSIKMLCKQTNYIFCCMFISAETKLHFFVISLIFRPPSLFVVSSWCRTDLWVKGKRRQTGNSSSCWSNENMILSFMWSRANENKSLVYFWVLHTGPLIVLRLRADSWDFCCPQASAVESGCRSDRVGGDHQLDVWVSPVLYIWSSSSSSSCC